MEASQVELAVKNPPANAGDSRDKGLIPGLERPLGIRNGNLRQDSCLGSPMDRGAWWATVLLLLLVTSVMSDSVWPHRRQPTRLLQARTLEWVAISFSNAWKWKVKVESLSHAWLLATPWTAVYQVSASMGFSSQEYWSGLPLPSPGLQSKEPQSWTCGWATENIQQIEDLKAFPKLLLPHGKKNLKYFSFQIFMILLLFIHERTFWSHIYWFWQVFSF